MIQQDFELVLDDDNYYEVYIKTINIIQSLLSGKNGTTEEQTIAEIKSLYMKEGTQKKESDLYWLGLCLRQTILKNSSNLEKCFLIVRLSLALAQDEFVEENTPMCLLEELVDYCTVSEIKEIISFLLSNFQQLANNMEPNKGKGLVFLRLCNEILRRLSRARDAELCGKLLTLLANAYPIHTRSGINLLGHFNADNVTRFEGMEKFDTNEKFSAFLLKEAPFSLSKIKNGDSNFFCLFWKIQDLFTNLPRYLHSKMEFSIVTKALDYIIDLFNEMKVYQASGYSGTTFSGKKYKGFSKYLPNPKLMLIQLEDSTFRAQFLVQTLFILNYSVSQMTSKVPEFSDQLDWANKTILVCVDLLKNLSIPESEKFADKVLSLLKSEELWIQWKQKSCPPFECKPAQLPPFSIDANNKNEIIESFSNTLQEYGDAGVAEIFNKGFQNDLKYQKSQFNIPELGEYLQPLVEQLNPQDMIEKEYRLSSNEAYQWKATRIIMRTCPDLLKSRYAYDLEELALSKDVLIKEKAETLEDFKNKLDSIILEKDSQSQSNLPKTIATMIMNEILESVNVSDESMDVDVEDSKASHV